MLGHLVFVDHPPDADPDLVTPGDAALLHHPLHLVQFLCGRQQKILPFGGAHPGQLGIPTGDQPLAGEVGMGQLEQVALIEQAHLQDTAVQQFPDPPGLQGTDPVHPLDVLERIDLLLGDHSPIAHQHEVLDPEGILDLRDLFQQRRRIPGVAFVNGHGGRAAARSG